MTDQMEIERAPMHDDLAEQAVVGAMMLSEDAAATALGLVRAGDFYSPRHQMLVEVIAEKLYKEPLDEAAMVSHLFRAGLLDRVGGAGYLSDLRMAGVPASVEYHARQVRALARRRRGEAALIRAQQAMRDPALDVDEACGQAQTVVSDAMTDQASGDSDGLFHSDMSDLLDKWRNPDPFDGISTGLGSLDQVIHRLKSGQMITIAGRPSMGKSVLAGDIARRAAWRQNESVLFVSLEMSRDEVRARMLAAEADVTAAPLINPPLSGVPEGHLQAVEKVLRNTEGSLLHLHAEGTITTADVRARALRLQRSVGLSLIVVDYLQLLTPVAPSGNRTVDVSTISRELKMLAMDLNVPVVAVSQLNRESVNRSDKRPMMSDLKESGSIEQDSNIVILLHREDYYDETVRPSEIDIMVVKNRNGQTATVAAIAQFHKMRIVDAIN